MLVNGDVAKVGKRKNFELEIKNWLDSGESITAYDATNSDGLLTISDVILDESEANPIIKIATVGVSIGVATVCFTWTSDGGRDECASMVVNVVNCC